MLITKITLLLLSTLCSLSVFAKTLDVRGYTFVIEEENLIEYMQKKINSSRSQESYQKILGKSIDQGYKPKPLTHLKQASEKRTFHFDPTYTLKEDMKDRNGTVIIAKGTTVNPLEKVTLSSSLLFFNGDNPKHVEWARSEQGQCKWVLTQGNPFELEEKEGRPVYFDQEGTIAKRFQLSRIPAKISQDGLFLKIEEIPVSELSSSEVTDE